MTVKPTIFVAQPGFRLRRAQDAARILPVVGGFLVFLPLLWGGGVTRNGIIYIFLIWLGLIIAAAVLSRVLKEIDTDPSQKPS